MRANRFAHDEKGGVAILVAMLASALISLGALAVDVSHSEGVKQRLQAAADAASLAASQRLPDFSAARAAAVELAAANAPNGYGTILREADVIFGIYDPETKVFTQSTATNVNAVRVSTSRTTSGGNAAPTFLGSVMGVNSVDVATQATAYRSTGPVSCVYVLDNSAVSAFSVSGGGKFNVPNCGVQVNSGHNKAAAAGNATEASAKRFCVRGGYNGSFTPVPVTGCAAVADPLVSLPEPTAGACQATGLTGPGTYCGAINVASAISLSPGLYYFRNAQVTVGSGANLTGSGVTFFFDSTSTLEIGSNAAIDLSAPTTGVYRGISIFQSRSAPINNVMKMTVAQTSP
jgi:Flp pilus assembly protein TadG